jgi:hypothetical protein
MPLKVLVAGGFDLTTDNSDLRAFCRALGAGIAERGHTLVNMCLTEMDKIVAEAAFERMKQLGVAEPDEHFRTYVLAGRKPIHNCGVLLRSRLSNLQIDKPDLYRPETVDASDVIILAGGFAGTLMVANWARLANKPLLPLTCFGDAAEQVFQRETQSTQESVGARLAGRIITCSIKSQLTGIG